MGTDKFLIPSTRMITTYTCYIVVSSWRLSISNLHFYQQNCLSCVHYDECKHVYKQTSFAYTAELYNECTDNSCISCKYSYQISYKVVLFIKYEIFLRKYIKFFCTIKRNADCFDLQLKALEFIASFLVCQNT